MHDVHAVQYRSQADLEKTSPSLRDGISAESEASYRKTALLLAREACLKLKLGQWHLNAALTFYYRFYAKRSYKKNDRFYMAVTCIFLAAKVEESPRSLDDVCAVCLKIKYSKSKDKAELAKFVEPAMFAQVKETVLVCERALLYTLNFQLRVEHPFNTSSKLLNEMKLSEDKTPAGILQISTNFLNDFQRTTLCLQYPANKIGLAAVWMAAKFMSTQKKDPIRLPLPDGKAFYEVYPITLEELLDIERQGMAMYIQKPTIKPEEPHGTLGAPSTPHLPEAAPSTVFNSTPDELRDTVAQSQPAQPQQQGGASQSHSSQQPPPAQQQAVPQRPPAGSAAHPPFDTPGHAAPTVAAGPAAQHPNYNGYAGSLPAVSSAGAPISNPQASLEDGELPSACGPSRSAAAPAAPCPPPVAPYAPLAVAAGPYATLQVKRPGSSTTAGLSNATAVAAPRCSAGSSSSGVAAAVFGNGTVGHAPSAYLPTGHLPPGGQAPQASFHSSSYVLPATASNAHMPYPSPPVSANAQPPAVVKQSHSMSQFVNAKPYYPSAVRAAGQMPGNGTTAAVANGCATATAGSCSAAVPVLTRKRTRDDVAQAEEGEFTLANVAVKEDDQVQSKRQA